MHKRIHQITEISSTPKVVAEVKELHKTSTTTSSKKPTCFVKILATIVQRIPVAEDSSYKNVILA